jgi:hypothetical protein
MLSLGKARYFQKERYAIDGEKKLTGGSWFADTTDF